MNRSAWINRIFIALGVVAGALLAYLSYKSLVVPLDFPDSYSWRMTLEMMAGYLLLLAVVILIVRRLPERILPVLVMLMLAGAFLAQAYIAHEMQVLPDVDLKYILEQDREMVANGEHIFTDRSYFGFYTNNIGIAIVIYWVFRAARLILGAATNYELAGGLFNVCMNLVTYVCAYRIARGFCGRRVSTVIMFLLVTNPVLYAYASYYYTDTVSLGMTTLAVALCLDGYNVQGKWRRTILLALGGFVMAFAFRVRVTSLIIVLAVAVWGVLRGRFRQMLHVAVPVLAGAVIASACYSGLYHYHIDFDTSETAIPMQSWLAMGADAGADGRYNEDDFRELSAQASRDDMVAISTEKWRERVVQNGVVDGCALVLRKEAIVWSRGTKFYFQYVQNVKDKNSIYEWIEGERAEYLWNYMQAYNTILLFLILASVMWSYVRRRRSGWQEILLIYWLGAVLFYVFWEAHPRQSVSYLALMTMMILPLLEQVCGEIRGRETSERKTGICQN